MEAAFEKKKEKYAKQAAECREAGWSIVFCTVEVGSLLVRLSSASWGTQEWPGQSWRRHPRTWQRRRKVPVSGWEGRTCRGENKGSRGSCRGRQGDVPAVAPPPWDVPGIMEQNINEGWLPADDLATTPLATSEVRQVALTCAFILNRINKSFWFRMWLVVKFVMKIRNSKI